MNPLRSTVASPTIRPRSRRLRAAAATLISLVSAFSLHGQADDSFGSAAVREGEGALIGILYDLKQTQKRERTQETEGTYRGVLIEFLRSDWDEAVLNRYFRVTRPVYATRINIRSMSADQAPRAFGVADIVEPRLWMVHYKGQIAAPADGLYRFSGRADDVIAVRLNGRLILVAGRPDCLPPASVWTSREPQGPRELRHGDWVSLRAGEVVDFDVLIGERPGGQFHAHLYVSKQGEAYNPDEPPVLSLGTPATATTPPWAVWSARQ